MNVLFIFLDGVGLGEDSPDRNPFAYVNTPILDHLLSGRKLLAKNTPFFPRYCTLISIDAQMGIEGLPQSATGQATLLTGINFPKILGYHYGPKSNQFISDFFKSNGKVNFNEAIENKPGSIFLYLKNSGKSASLLNAYPPSYFVNINSRKRNHSVIPLAATTAGIRLFDQNDLFMGKAISADFTGHGWQDHLNLHETPIIKPEKAGSILASLAKNYHFSMFEFWETDIVGHKQNFVYAINVLRKLDQVLEGLLNNWDFDNNGILITSDHGNMEDLSTRRHTTNQVSAIFIGPPDLQRFFSQSIRSIGDIANFICQLQRD